MSNLIRVLIIGATAFLAPSVPDPALADETQIARQKINVSGRQRMLSQRMSAAACMVKTGLDQGERAQIAQSAHSEFSKALLGLRDGDSDLGLTAEENLDIRAALNNVEALWNQMGPAVEQLASGYANDQAMLQVMSMNGDLLRLSNEAVQGFVATYGGSNIDASVAKAIDVAGRQRMLSQRMIKARCFKFVGVGGKAVIDELHAAIDLFDVSLDNLIHGNPGEGIAPPPNTAVADQLATVSALWDEFQTQLESSIGNDSFSWGQMQALAFAGDELLAQAHQAVLRYVEATAQ